MEKILRPLENLLRRKKYWFLTSKEFMQIKLKEILGKRLLLHVYFWAIAYYILLKIFSTSEGFEKIDIFYTGIFSTTLFLAVAFNLFYLIPKFLFQNKHLLFAVGALVNIALFSFLNQVLFERFIDYILPGYYFISYYEFIDLLKFFGSFIIISSLLKLTRSWFIENEAKQKLIVLEKEKMQAELKALLNQINPHFLFNSLNVIYSLSINSQKETSEAVLKLSEILRYILYQTNQPLVKISKEIELMENFIHLQRYRIAPGTSIIFEHEILPKDGLIPPMILLPLLENSFKHGLLGDIKNTFIYGNIKANDKHLTLLLKNNKNRSETAGNEGGIGIENLKLRLKMLFGERYLFKITDNESFFQVELQIPVSADVVEVVDIYS
jgi:hypothetical protein